MTGVSLNCICFLRKMSWQTQSGHLWDKMPHGLQGQQIVLTRLSFPRLELSRSGHNMGTATTAKIKRRAKCGDKKGTLPGVWPARQKSLNFLVQTVAFFVDRLSNSFSKVYWQVDSEWVPGKSEIQRLNWRLWTNKQKALFGMPRSAVEVKQLTASTESLLLNHLSSASLPFLQVFTQSLPADTRSPNECKLDCILKGLLLKQHHYFP